MTGQPWLVGQVDPEEFFWVLQEFFGPTSGQQEFVHAIYENIILRELIVLLFMLVILCRHYAARYMDRI